MPHSSIDLKKVHTYPLRERHNLVNLSDLVQPEDPLPSFENDEIDQVVESVLAARRKDRPVILMLGGHVIKCGLGPLLIDLMHKGVVTHIAGNGAVSIHDFELAMIGETSEDVRTSIEDGTFGMAEETGASINRALRLGAKDGLGYGESLGRYIDEGAFPYREYSVLYNAFKLGLPATIHVTIGADIIHQHPDCDFGILGWASGQDFKIFCASISNLENGVFLNLGSAVTGAEVFLKAISITRNLGYPVHGLSTANFDLIPLGKDYRSPVGKDTPEYYYRPRKNIVNRPTSLNGIGYHIQGDHLQTIPYLYHGVCEGLKAHPLKVLPEPEESEGDFSAGMARVEERSPQAAEALRDLLGRRPHLKDAAPSLCRTYLSIAESFERGGTLFIYGNGGSMSDALHISGELLKSFSLPRPLTQTQKARLSREQDGEFVAENLENGFRVVALGTNPSLNSAIENDFEARGLGVAQQLNALARPGDVFLGISTSGKARNIYYAAIAAHAAGVRTILLTGEGESRLSEISEISIHAPSGLTDLVQEEHVALYHCLCDMLERDFFG
ncbi:SIS domain-containing protein [Chloroflexota bacterium]